jgi:GNAT superfamily N-acetyltransferase
MSQFAAEVLVAAGAAALTLIVARIRRFISDRRLQRKYDVSGRFITKYVDKVVDEDVTSKAPAVLTQKGRTVSGDTTDLDGRTWQLQGTIEDGFLNGVYRARDPSDPGRGTFFLQVSRGDMTGVWSGWDSANRNLGGGNYEFRRALDSWVRSAQIGELASICALLGDALGDFYVDVETVRESMTDTEKATCLVAAGQDAGLWGASTYYLVNRDSFVRFLPLGQEPLAEALQVFRFNDSVGLLRSLAVRPERRDRGIATQLVRKGISWSEQRGATAMLTVAWTPPEGCHLLGIMKAEKFDAVMQIDNYWTEDSKQKRYDCPVCGPVCVCSATIFRKSLAGRRYWRPTETTPEPRTGAVVTAAAGQPVSDSPQPSDRTEGIPISSADSAADPARGLP